MVTFIDWLVPAFVGVFFTLMGCLKLYGLRQGIVVGQDKPIVQRLCGT